MALLLWENVFLKNGFKQRTLRPKGVVAVPGGRPKLLIEYGITVFLLAAIIRAACAGVRAAAFWCATG